jgi:ribosomal protein S18 acetylase RimI-like enzyme
MASAELQIRRLEPCDAQAFQLLRIEGFTLSPREFRFAPEDEGDMPISQVEARLSRDFVVGAFCGDALVGIAGLMRLEGAKQRHKALLWGMYLRAEYRGRGGADALMAALLAHARSCVEIVMLTVMADNPRAMSLYRRWGFTTYGVEPRSVKVAEGVYLDEALMSLRLV